MGLARVIKKMNFWRMIENMVLSFYGPWVIIGDLKGIKIIDEKREGQLISGSSVNCLKDFMSDTGAIDLGFTGPSFTWFNRHEGLANIKERLDQCFCNQEWNYFSPKPKSSTSVIIILIITQYCWILILNLKP